MEQIECSETSAYKIQTPGNHPEENIQHTEHGESLKSKICYVLQHKVNKYRMSLLNCFKTDISSVCNCLGLGSADV
jgi:hypothetical protein